MSRHSNSVMKPYALVLELMLVLFLVISVTQVTGSFVLTSKLFQSPARMEKPSGSVSAQVQQELNEDERLYFDDGINNNIQYSASANNGKAELQEEKVSPDQSRDRRSRAIVTLVGRLPEKIRGLSNEMSQAQRDNRKTTKSPEDLLEEEISKLDFVGPLRLMLDQALHSGSLSALRRKKVSVVGPEERKAMSTTTNHLGRQRRELDQDEHGPVEEVDLRNPLQAINTILQQVFHSALEKWVKTVATLRERVALRIIKITAFEDTFHLSDALSNFNITRQTPLFLIAGGIRANISEALPSTYTIVPLDQLLQHDEGNEPTGELPTRETTAPKESPALEILSQPKTTGSESESVAPAQVNGISGHFERDLATRTTPPTVPPFHTVPDMKEKGNDKNSPLHGHGSSKENVFSKAHGAARESDEDGDSGESSESTESDEAGESGNNSSTTTTSTTKPPTTTSPIEASSSSPEPIGTTTDGPDTGETESPTTEAETPTTSGTTEAPVPLNNAPEPINTAKIPEIQSRSILDTKFFMMGKRKARQGRDNKIDADAVEMPDSGTNLNTPVEPHPHTVIHPDDEPHKIQIYDIPISDGPELSPEFSTDMNHNQREKRSAGCPQDVGMHETRLDNRAVGSKAGTGGIALSPYYAPLNSAVAKPKPPGYNLKPLKPKYTSNTLLPDQQNGPSFSTGFQPNYTLVIIPPLLIHSPPHHVSDSLTSFIQALSDSPTTVQKKQ